MGIAAQLLEQRRGLALWAAGRQVAAEVSRHDALDQIIDFWRPRLIKLLTTKVSDITLKMINIIVMWKRWRLPELL